MSNNIEFLFEFDEDIDSSCESKSKISVSSESKGLRVDSFLAEQEGITRSTAAKLCEGGRVESAGKKLPKNYKLRGDEVITISYPPVESGEALPQEIPLDVVYEDDDIIVINKPTGMVVHPAPGNPDGTLVNALLFHCKDSLSGIGGIIRPGIVHRIDKDTSGLLVVAKNDEAHLSLSEQIKRHDVSRIYYAIACGSLKNEDGTIDAPIGRSANDRKKMAVIRDPSRSSKDAVTHYTVLERFNGFTFVRCRLETGRTHQIRVHLSSIGHPLLGDEVYGGDKTKFGQASSSLISGQCLHAGELSLTHPKTGQLMTFTAPLPESMTKLLEKLRRMQ